MHIRLRKDDPESAGESVNGLFLSVGLARHQPGTPPGPILPAGSPTGPTSVSFFSIKACLLQVIMSFVKSELSFVAGGGVVAVCPRPFVSVRFPVSISAVWASHK